MEPERKSATRKTTVSRKKTAPVPAPAGVRKKTAAVKGTRPRKSITSEERTRLIAEKAYLRAECRGFRGGDPVEDWLAAEAEVDAMLMRPGGEGA
jgi:hypothetical protein